MKLHPVGAMRTDGRTDGRTDMTKLTVAFLNFTNAPKKCFVCLNRTFHLYATGVFISQQMLCNIIYQTLRSRMGAQATPVVIKLETFL